MRKGCAFRQKLRQDREMRTKLTDKAVRALKPPSGTTASGKPKKEQITFDSELRGLAIRVTLTGGKHWILQKKANGKNHRVSLGEWPGVDAGAARAEATRLLGKMAAEGVQAVAQTKVRRSKEETASDLIRDLLADYSRLHLSRYKDHSRNMTESGLAAVLAGHENKPLAALTTNDVVVAADGWRSKGQHTTANRRLEQLRTFVRWCSDRGVDIPALKFPRTKEISRERVLTREEFTAMLKAAQEMAQPDFSDAVLLLALTGLRRTEVSELHSREVDLPNKVIRIEGDRMKSGLPVTVPLSAAALEVIERRLRFIPSGYLFARWSNGEKPFSGFSRLKTKLDAAMTEKLGGHPDPWRLHDIRRSVATMMVSDLNIDPILIEQSVLHHATALSSIARVYQRGQRTEAASEALQAWGEHVNGMLSDNVVSITDRGRSA
jgi:integrase